MFRKLRAGLGSPRSDLCAVSDQAGKLPQGSRGLGGAGARDHTGRSVQWSEYMFEAKRADQVTPAQFRVLVVRQLQCARIREREDRSVGPDHAQRLLATRGRLGNFGLTLLGDFRAPLIQATSGPAEWV